MDPRSRMEARPLLGNSSSSSGLNFSTTSHPLASSVSADPLNRLMTVTESTTLYFDSTRYYNNTYLRRSGSWLNPMSWVSDCLKTTCGGDSRTRISRNTIVKVLDTTTNPPLASWLSPCRGGMSATEADNFYYKVLVIETPTITPLSRSSSPSPLSPLSSPSSPTTHHSTLLQQLRLLAPPVSSSLPSSTSSSSTSSLSSSTQSPPRVNYHSSINSDHIHESQPSPSPLSPSSSSYSHRYIPLDTSLSFASVGDIGYINVDHLVDITKDLLPTQDTQQPDRSSFSSHHAVSMLPPSSSANILTTSNNINNNNTSSHTTNGILSHGLVQGERKEDESSMALNKQNSMSIMTTPSLLSSSSSSSSSTSSTSNKPKISFQQAVAELPNEGELKKDIINKLFNMVKESGGVSDVSYSGIISIFAKHRRTIGGKALIPFITQVLSITKDRGGMDDSMYKCIVEGIINKLASIRTDGKGNVLIRFDTRGADSFTIDIPSANAWVLKSSGINTTTTTNGYSNGTNTSSSSSNGSGSGSSNDTDGGWLGMLSGGSSNTINDADRFSSSKDSGNTPEYTESEPRTIVIQETIKLTLSDTGIKSIRSGDICVRKLMSIPMKVWTEWRPNEIAVDVSGSPYLRTENVSSASSSSTTKTSRTGKVPSTRPIIDPVTKQYVPVRANMWLGVSVIGLTFYVPLPDIPLNPPTK